MDVLQEAQRGSHEPDVNFWKIESLVINTENITLYRQYTYIHVSMHLVHSYFQMPKSKQKRKYCFLYKPLVNTLAAHL
jgi:hypothetical protein